MGFASRIPASFSKHGYLLLCWQWRVSIPLARRRCPAGPRRVESLVDVEHQHLQASEPIANLVEQIAMTYEREAAWEDSEGAVRRRLSF
jgi:hypothetical protein